MIRASALLSLLILLVLVLYVPTTHPPQHFVSQMRIEHIYGTAFWGPQTANRILDRSVRMQTRAIQAAPIPHASYAPPTPAGNTAAEQELAEVNQRLFRNPYFRSVEALLLLGSYRLSTLIECTPWLVMFMLASLSDGWFVRLLKAKVLIPHDPEKFSIYICMAIITLCSTVVGLAMPYALHPILMLCTQVVFSALLGLSLGCFHRRA